MVKIPDRQRKLVEKHIKHVAARMKACRNSRGLRMVDVGEHMEVGHTRVADAESGRDDFKMSTLLRFSQAIGVHPAKFFYFLPPFRIKPCKSGGDVRPEVQSWDEVRRAFSVPSELSAKESEDHLVSEMIPGGKKLIESIAEFEKLSKKEGGAASTALARLLDIRADMIADIQAMA